MQHANSTIPEKKVRLSLEEYPCQSVPFERTAMHTLRVFPHINTGSAEFTRMSFANRAISTFANMCNTSQEVSPPSYKFN